LGSAGNSILANALASSPRTDSTSKKEEITADYNSTNENA